MDCFLCTACVAGESDRWYDRPLSHRRGVGTVLPGLGGLTSGYILVSPEVHVPSILALGTVRRRAFGEYLSAVLDKYRQLGQYIFWEHGGDSAGTARTSACVDHAHLHVSMGHFALGEEITGKQQFTDLCHWLDQPGHETGKPYLLFGRSGSVCWSAPDIGVPQYFRRRLAAAVGRTDHWDYAAVPNYDDARSTAATVAGLLKEVA